MQEFINSTINTKVYNQMSDEHQIIKIQDKECLIENIGTIVSGDTNSCLLTFEINRFQDGVDLSRKKVECIYRNRNGEYPPDEMVNVKYNDEIIRFSWLLPYHATCAGGIIIASIKFYGENEYGEEYACKTKNFKLKVESAIDSVDETEVPTQNWVVHIENCIDDLNSQIEEILTELESAVEEVFV